MKESDPHYTALLQEYTLGVEEVITLLSKFKDEFVKWYDKVKHKKKMQGLMDFAEKSDKVDKDDMSSSENRSSVYGGKSSTLPYRQTKASNMNSEFNQRKQTTIRKYWILIRQLNYNVQKYMKYLRKHHSYQGKSAQFLID